MAETDTLPIAEASRDRLPASQEPTGPSTALVAEPPETPVESATAIPGGVPSFGDVSAMIQPRLDALRQAHDQATQRVMDARAAGAVQTAQALAEYQAKQQEPKPERPLLPPMPPPPSRELHEFLSPVDGESPTASITKLINALGLFAAGAGGLARGDARGSLAALTGALTGWQQGDILKADLAFKDWEAKTKLAMEKWSMERQDYLDIMADKNLSLSQMLDLWKIKTAQTGNEEAAAVAEQGSLEKNIGWLHAEQAHADNLAAAYAKLVQSKAEFDERMATRREQMERDENYRRDMMAARDQYQQQILELRRQGQEQTARLAADNLAFRREALADRQAAREDKRLEGTKPTGEAMKRYEDFGEIRDNLAEISRLLPNVRVDKLMGGIAPTINTAIQTGKLGPFPIPRAALGKLTEDENRFLALVRDAADVVLRARSGAAITDSEFQRMMGFLITEQVTPDVFKTRLQLAQDVADAKLARFGEIYPMAPKIPPRNISLGGWSATPAEKK